MSKINIEIDTSEKNVSVKVDGESVDDVTEIIIYSDESSFGFHTEIATRQKVGDMKKVTRIVTSGSNKSKAIEHLPSVKKIGDFLVLENTESDLTKQLLKYFGKND